MMIAPYVESLGCDAILPRLVNLWRKSITEKDDDVLILNVGTTGSGKTNLSLRQASLYFPGAKTEQIALTKTAFADGLAEAKDLPKGERLLLYDELELGKRSSMTNWNKDMMQLYFKIRGLNIFHIWNHPSLNQVDGEFIRERVNGVFFTFEKTAGKPRRYYFFPKERMLAYLKDHKKLDLQTLKLHARKYAFYQGSYAKYTGVLEAPYLQQKSAGMHEAVEEFKHKYGREHNGIKGISLSMACKDVGVSRDTFEKLVTKALKQGRLEENNIKNPVGMYKFTPQHLEIIRDVAKND